MNQWCKCSYVVAPVGRSWVNDGLTQWIFTVIIKFIIYLTNTAPNWYVHKRTNVTFVFIEVIPISWTAWKSGCPRGGAAHLQVR